MSSTQKTARPTTLAQRAAEQAACLARWLASGEVQSPAGAFCAWREEGGELAFEYPEITGYALTWLASRRDPSEAEIEAGRRAAVWLLERLEANDLSAHAQWDGDAVYTFDLGVISSGLISFGKVVGEPSFIDGGERVGRHLAALFLGEETPPQVDPNGPPSGRPPTWSNAGHPHVAKCVQAMLLAGQGEAAERLIAHAATFQHPSGYFLTQPDEGLVMLHPHFYTVEAMWMWGTARADEDAIACARRATEWAWRHQLPDGGLPRLVNLTNEDELGIEQLDVTSQAVRAALLVGVEVDGLDRALARLLAAVRPAGQGAALPYQTQSESAHLNAWVTMFGAQALELAAQNERHKLEWHELV
jgi:hypothetical protein